MLTEHDIADIILAINKDVARCNRWLAGRMVSDNERIECRRLLAQYKVIKVKLNNMEVQR